LSEKNHICLGSFRINKGIFTAVKGYEMAILEPLYRLIGTYQSKRREHIHQTYSHLRHRS